MCEWHDPGIPHSHPVSPVRSIPRALSIDELMPYARFLAEQPELRRTSVGFIGYGATKPGDRVLVAVDTQYDMDIVEAVCRALRDRGARVDVVVTEAEPDREFEELDEIRASIRRCHWAEQPRRWEGIAWIEELAATRDYDLLVHGKGGPTPPTRMRYEAIPWLLKEHFANACNLLPHDVHRLINEKTWRWLWEKGRGGEVRLTDVEGTDVRWHLIEEYYDKETWPSFNQPWWGHLFCHPSSPVHEKEDAEGVIAGTTNHFSRPYPQIKVQLDGGRVVRITGGGGYGEAWRELEHETKAIEYPLFPRAGLFWFTEVALGTNPKIVRPRDIRRLSSGGTEWDRNRSGVLHIGFGTRWRSPAESWAIEQGKPYGHIHVHLLLPTLEVTSREGERVKIIDRGHLTALDDPEVRDLAARYGDPDTWLAEDWTPEIPGVTAPGSYEEYAQNPSAWIYRLAEATPA